MYRLIPIALFVLMALGAGSYADEGGCCGQCGCKTHCQLMCEWRSCKILRYKIATKDCPPPCCECCDDRWILGCCKPIRTMNLVPFEENKKFLVRKYYVHTCPQCGTSNQTEAPATDIAPPLPPAPKTAEAVNYETEKDVAPAAAPSARRFPWSPANK